MKALKAGKAILPMIGCILSLLFGSFELCAQSEAYLTNISQIESDLEKAIDANSKRNFEEARQLTQKAESLLQSMPKDSLTKVKYLECLDSYAHIYRKGARLQEALDAFKFMWEEGEKNLGKVHPLTLRGKEFYALSLVDLGRLDEALDIQLELYEHFNNQKTSLDLAHITYALSQNYQRKKDYDKSLTYAAKALALFKDYYKEDHKYIAFAYNQMGNALEAEKKYEEARSWYLKAVDVLVKLYGEKSFRASLSLMNVGKSYAFVEDYDTAIDYYKEVWEWFDHSLEAKHVRYVELWLSLGYAYYAKGDLVNARKIFDLAYKRACESAPEKSFDRVQAGLYLSFAMTDPVELLDICHISIWGAANGKIPDNPLILPELSEVRIEQNFLSLLLRKASALKALYQSSKDTTYLMHAMEAYDLAGAFLDKKNQAFLNGGVQISFSSDYRKLYEERVALTKILYELTGNKKYIESAFNSMEKSRGLFLLRRLAASAYDQVLPDTLIQRKRDYLKKIASVEVQADREEDDTVKGNLRAQVFDLKSDLEAFDREMQAQYPIINKTKEQFNIVKLTDLQAGLEEGDVFIEYLEQDSVLFFLEVRKGSTRLHSLPQKERLYSQIDSLNYEVKNRKWVLENGESQDRLDRIAKLSRNIYTSLFSTVSFESCQNLTLVPDGKLHFLPFDILISEEVIRDLSFASLPYLIKKCPINYVFSGTLNAIQNDPPPSNKILALAPSYDAESNVLLASRSGFSALTHTSKEVQSIKSLWPRSKVYLNETASEERFKQEASEYGLLHLAMHAFTDDENPSLSGLIFTENNDAEDDVLYSYELENMELNAHLAVLSACNTGSGVLKRGEGVMSLARSFREAGVPNIVMSLWQADDEATRMIMESFYKYLKEGQGKNKALQKAKIDFINSKYKSHPHFWAAFSLIGDMEQIPATPESNSLLLIGILLISLVFLYFLIARTKRGNLSESY